MERKTYSEIKNYSRATCIVCHSDEYTKENPCFLGDHEIPFHQECIEKYKQMERDVFIKCKEVPDEVLRYAIRSNCLKRLEDKWCIYWDENIIDFDSDEELVEWVKEELRTRGTDSGMGNVKYVIHNNKVVKFKITANISMKLEK